MSNIVLLESRRVFSLTFFLLSIILSTAAENRSASLMSSQMSSSLDAARLICLVTSRICRFIDERDFLYLRMMLTISEDAAMRTEIIR